jgi:hypothetical protein
MNVPRQETSAYVFYVYATIVVKNSSYMKLKTCCLFHGDTIFAQKKDIFLLFNNFLFN